MCLIHEGSIVSFSHVNVKSLVLVVVLVAILVVILVVISVVVSVVVSVVISVVISVVVLESAACSLKQLTPPPATINLRLEKTKPALLLFNIFLNIQNAKCRNAH